MATRTEPRERSERRARILSELLGTHRAPLRRQAHRNSSRPDDAVDALQDACLVFLRSYEGAEGKHALRWLMLAVKHCAWERSTRATRDAPLELTSTDEQAAAGKPRIAPLCERPGPAESAERRERAASFLDALGALKPDHRDALLLLGLGYSYREIAQRHVRVVGEQGEVAAEQGAGAGW
jgi:DNA-directed RNA polymerase specialized sigma24 family protein